MPRTTPALAMPPRRKQARTSQRRPKLPSLQLPRWLMSGGPVGGPMNVARVMIATGIATQIVRKRARNPSQPPAKAKQPIAQSASVTAADAATATRNSANRGPMRRLKQQRHQRPMAPQLKRRATTRAVHPGKGFTARTETRKNSRENSKENLKESLKENFRASRRATAKDARVAARRTANMPAARRRANVSVRPIPIRRSPNWRR